MAKYIKPNEHVFVAGKTGTGKTWLARKYLAGYKNVVCLDTKGMMNWPEISEEKITVVKKLEQLKDVKTDKIIYRPVAEEMSNDFYDAFFKWVYFRKNTIVWIDEAMSVCTPHKIPFYYKACLTRGRELNVACWSLTQRPTGISALIMSEATHIIVFDLNMPQDREKIVNITGMKEFLEKPSVKYGKYSFWYHNVEEDKAIPARLIKSKEMEVIKK